MEKIVIKAKNTDSRSKIFQLITDGMNCRCDDCPGGYTVKHDELKYVGVRCEQITLYF